MRKIDEVVRLSLSIIVKVMKSSLRVVFMRIFIPIATVKWVIE